MSRVKDLEIRGIRNFGDEKTKVRIRFSRPITLILGPNGTGKTTIIESLKYVTSGEFPPDSDRGKSFVHEPKLSLNHTVRGQVKAKIIDKRGEELTITRTMQVSRQKTNALKFQAIDNTISRVDDKGKPVQISSRCTDVDREMLIAMGVSKPILNYVIFCHQEESNWPLEDGKKLKDRFDEIFDTSKYNKAMDTTTKFIKDLQAELNTIKAYEEGLQNMVEEVESLEGKLNDCVGREEKANSRMQEIDQSIKPIDKRSDEILKVKEDYDKLVDQIKITEHEYRLINSKIDSLKQHIKHMFKGSKSDLIQKIEAHDTNYSQKSQNKILIEHELEKIKRTENVLVAKFEDAKIQVGSLRQKKQAFDEKLMKRNDLLLKNIKTWNLSEIDEISSEKEATSYIDQIDAKLKEKADFMKKRFQDNEQEEKYFQREVDQLRVQKTEIESEMSLKEKERQNISLEIAELKTKINKTGEAEKRLNSIESDLQKATKSYNDLLQNFDEESISRNLQTESSNKKELNQKLINIDSEIRSLNQQSSQQAELELHLADLNKKEEEILQLKNKYKNDLESLFGKNVPETGLKHNLEKLQHQLTIDKNNLQKSIDSEQKKVTELETALKYNQTEIKKMRSELEDCQEKISLQCQGNDFNEILKLQEKKVKSLQDERGMYANQSVMYEKYINQLKAKSCCPLCERNFQNSSDEKRLEKKLILEIEKSPQNLQKCEKELKVEQVRYDKLLQLKPIIEQIKEIEENKLPLLRKAEEKKKLDLERSREKLEDLKLSLAEPEEKLNTCKKIFGGIILLDNYINEKQRIGKLVEVKKSEMAKAGKIGDRTMTEAQNERDAIRKRLASVEGIIDNIQSALREGQQKVQKAREHKNKLNEEVLKIRQNMQELKQLQDKRRSLIEKDNTLEDSVKSLRQKLVVADNALTEKVTELNDLKRKNREEYDQDSEFKSKRSTEMHELKTTQIEVEKFIRMNIDESLNRIQSESDQVKQDCDKKKAERLNLEEQIRSLEEECRSQERRKQELEDNLELMNLEEEVEKVKEKTSRDKTTLQNLRYSELKQEYLRLQREKEELEEEKNSTKGALGEMRNTISKLKKDLNQEKYRMARRNLREKQCELTVQEQAIANLKTYVTVLDKAMIQFHEERMNTVNNIMHQLWTLVYSGNDTSSIQIRVQTTEGIGDKKRSYNYKLVQVKRSTEMDMKGKCSAGQKVLASIIIRMALADTFCSDCSVLALDEPTTNLDEENARNLASMLSKVVQLRAQHNKSFQLIVISHDERFISHLSSLNGYDRFQELYRNTDGYSLVKLRDSSDSSKINSQDDGKFELDSDDSDDEDNDVRVRREEKTFGNSRKRQVSPDDSPPRRATKRRA